VWKTRKEWELEEEEEDDDDDDEVENVIYDSCCTYEETEEEGDGSVDGEVSSGDECCYKEDEDYDYFSSDCDDEHDEMFTMGRHWELGYDEEDDDREGEVEKMEEDRPSSPWSRQGRNYRHFL